VPYYALFYDEVVDDFLNRRVAFREEHLRLARESRARNELQLAGALAEPADGALLVFRADGPTVVEEFVRSDPYVQNGLIKKWRIRNWTVVVGNQ